MKTMDKLKCLLFGHPRNRVLHDGGVQLAVTSAKLPFLAGYCTRCEQLVFLEGKYPNIVQEVKAQLDREEEERLKNPRADGLDMFDYFVLKGIVESKECHPEEIKHLRRIVEKMERTWPKLQSLKSDTVIHTDSSLRCSDAEKSLELRAVNWTQVTCPKCLNNKKLNKGLAKRKERHA